MYKVRYYKYGNKHDQVDQAEFNRDVKNIRKK